MNEKPLTKKMITDALDKMKESQPNLPDANMALYHVPTIQRTIQRAMDIEAENAILRAELERPTPTTDEDVDRATDWLKTGKYDTQVGDHEYQADSRFHPDTTRFRMTAIRALKQYRPGHWFEWVDVTNGRGGHKCSECNSYAPSYQNGVEYLSLHCPNCGRRLRGDA